MNRITFRMLFIAGCILTAGLYTTTAQTNLNTTLLGQWSEGQSNAIAVAGEYVFLGNGGYVDVLHAGAQPVPVKVGRIAAPGFVWTMERSGQYLYVGGIMNGLQVIDIGNPAAPVIAGSLDLPESVYSMAVGGNYLYLGAERLFHVVDISDPHHPVLKGTVDDHDIVPLAMAHFGHYCIIASREYGAIIIDVADPAAPVRVASFADNSYATSVSVRGNRAYVCESGRVLRILDITDPVHPVEAGHYYQVVNIGDMAFSGSLMFAACYGKGMYVFDTANPDTLSMLSSVRNTQLFTRIRLEGNEAHIACGATGYCRMNIADHLAPVVVAESPGTGNSVDVEVQGRYAYVACEQSGVIVLDATDAANPMRIATLPVDNKAVDVEIAGANAYVCNHSKGLLSVDITNPAVPVVIGSADTCSPALAAKVAGQYAYVACGSKGLRLVNIADPSHPVVETTIDTIGNIVDVACNGRQVFALEKSKGVHMFDITALPAVSRTGPIFDILYAGEALSVDDSLLAVAGPDGALIWNVADPSSPILRGRTDGTTAIEELDIAYPYLYITDLYKGVWVYDIIDPGAPVLTGLYRTNTYALGTAVRGDTLFIADWYDGVYVVHFERGGVGVRDDAAPSSVALSAYPNPVMSTATILFFLESSREVTVGVYNSLGVPVATLISERQCVGQHNVIWTPDRSRTQPGIYYIRLSSEGVVYTQRCVYLK